MDEEVKEEWRLVARSVNLHVPSTQRNTALQAAAKTSSRKMTVYIAHDGFDDLVGPLAMNLTPAPDVEPKVPKFTYDKMANCWHCTFDCPEGVSQLSTTVKLEGGIFDNSLQTVTTNIDKQNAVFVQSSQSQVLGVPVFHSFFKCMWSLFSNELQLLSAQHAQLLATGLKTNLAFDTCMKDYIEISKTFTGDMREQQLLVLLGLAGQYIELQQPFNHGKVAETMWQLLDTTFDQDLLVKWGKNPNNFFTLRLVRWLYEFDRCAPVSSFRFTTLTSLLELLGDEEIGKATFGKSVKNFALQKTHLPDFKVPSSLGDHSEEAKTVGTAAQVAWGDLERSETLIEREVKWEKSVKSAEAVLHRFWLAKNVVIQERAWLQDMITGAHHAARVKGDIPGWGLLNNCNNRSLAIINSIDDSIEKADAGTLFAAVQELATRGRNTREQTRTLVQKYGPYVGHDDGRSFSITTIAGLIRDPRPSSIDGPLLHRKEPYASLLPTEAVVMASGDIIFSEAAMNKIRVFYPRTNTIATVLGMRGIGFIDGEANEARLRGPGPLCKISETEILVGDTGNACLRVMKHSVDGWSIKIAGGQPGVRQIKDGALPVANFSSITSIEKVMVKGQEIYYIADAGNLRRVIGGLKTGKVETLIRAKPAPVDGTLKNAATVQIKCLCYVPHLEHMFFIDRHAVRAVELSSKGVLGRVKTILGSVNKSATAKLPKGGFDTPSGLTFTMVRREQPLPVDTKAREEYQKVVEKTDLKNVTTLMEEYDAKDKLFRTMISTLVVSDSGNNCVRAIYNTGKKSQFFESTECEIILGRGNSSHAWKDGIGTVSQLAVPGALVPTGDGIIMCEQNRLRLVAPPSTLSKAASDYTKNQEIIEELANTITELSRKHNLHTNSIIDAVRNSRLTLLKGRSEAEDLSYRQYAEYVINEKLPTILGLIAGAPSVKSLRWVTKLALDKKVVHMDLEREPTVAHDTKDSDLPYNLSSVPVKPLGLQDAVENAIFNIQWLPSDDEQRAVLEELIGLAEDVPDLLGPIALEKLLTSNGFRVRPCKELFKLVGITLDMPEGGGLIPDPILAEALNKWLVAALPKETENEKMSNEKIIRGTLRLWTDYYNSGCTKHSSIADMLFTWTMNLAVESTPAKMCLLNAVGQGITQFIDPDEEVPAAPPPEVFSKILEIGKQVQAEVLVADVFVYLTMDGKEQDEDLSTDDRNTIYWMLADKLASLGVITAGASLGDLLQKDIKSVWVKLLPWYMKLAKGANPYAACGEAWERLAALCKIVGSKFNSGQQGLQNHTFPVSVVAAMVANKSDITDIWGSIGIKNAEEIIDTASSLLNTLSADIRTYEEVAQALFDDNALSNYVSELNQKWGSLRIVDIKYIFRRIPDGLDGLVQLPVTFLEAAKWLHSQCGSGVFHYVWDGIEETDAEKKIFTVRTGLLKLYDTIEAKQLSFTEFLKFCEILSPTSHEALPCIDKPWTESQALLQFCRVCKELQWDMNEDPDKVSFPEPGVRLNNKFYSTLTETVGMFRRMQRVKCNSNELLLNLDLLSKLVRPSGQHTVVAERAALNELIEEVAKFNYDELTLHNLDGIGVILSRIDDRILEISGDLIESISTHSDFLEWLSEHASNQNFASSIEMAMGRPEMECPPELWVIEETGPGHPNEAVLSQLTSVRTALHRLLYGSPTFMRDTLKEIVGCIGHLPIYTSEATAKTLAELAPLQLALAELLSGDGDASALNRLRNLSLPNWETAWVIAGDSKSADVTMWLEYKVPRNERVIDSKQTVGELLDYQSAVVLAKARDEDLAHVQEFVAKFGWIRELCAEFQKLKTAGHPERQRFTAKIPYSLSSDEVLSEVKGAQADLLEWELQVDKLRLSHPFINTMMLRQILRLCAHCSSDEPEVGFAPLAEEIANTLFPAGPLEDVQGLLMDVWKDHERQTSDSFMGKIDMMMSIASPGWTVFPKRVMDMGSCSFDKGVKLVVTDKEQVLSTLLSCYMRNGALPEWHQVLWITPESTVEQICNLLLRWAFTKTQALYCLIGVEDMAESAYHKVTSMLLDLESKATNPLIVIGTERDNYVVRQLAHWREAIGVLPQDELRRIGDSISEGDKKVTLYTSSTAGSGKTFQIRTDAGKRKVVHVPVHKACTPGELITLIEVNKKRRSVASSDAYVLHVDLADSVSQSVSVVLFELLVLGSLYDVQRGMRWFKDKFADIAVETAPDAANLPIFNYLPKKESVVSKDTFKITPDALKLGMREAYTAARADGTITDSVVTTTLHTAHSRLSWVMWAMSVVDKKKAVPASDMRDACPSDFKLKENTLAMISRAANLSEPISLWSVWAFVDVAFWMLFAAFRRPQAGDPLASAPPALRAEAFDFICRTAADFATRQKRVKGDDLVWLRSSQVSRASDGTVLGSVKNFYKRCQFRSNGQPVFRMGSYLDPSYIHFTGDKWVMCDTISDQDLIAASEVGKPLLTPWQTPSGTIELVFLTWDQLAKERPEIAKSAIREDGMLPITDEPLGDLKTWNEANHEAFMVGNRGEQHVIHLLAINQQALKKRMHPKLLEFLEKDPNSTVGANDKHPFEVLSALTGIYRDEAAAAKLLGGTYCMTGDVVLKMLAVYVRVRCGVPVLLMGECGCGKTHMLRYLCAWLGAELLILDVHGGTTEADIINIFEDATKKILAKTANEVYVFLDEVNTCQHMGLIAEVIVSRSLYGKQIHNNIVVLAAANPYRMRKQIDSAPGLAYKPPTRTDVVADPLENLVYRVHPIPKRLMEYVFDFGSLTESVEKKYIKAMVSVYVHDREGQAAVTELLCKAQNYIREVEGDPSVVSLRDLKRALRLSRWFMKYGGGKATAERHAWSAPAILGIAHVFYFRLSSDEHRNKLLETLRLGLHKIEGFEWLFPTGAMAKIIKSTMTSMCSKLEVEDGIAMNQALKENLYVTLICIFNRIPIFVVGKPGSSKTLTLQVLSNNLKGDQSTSKFWAKFPSIHIFPYQCSPLSTAAGIRHQFDIACSYQKKADRTIVVLLLDEVGLAEHSPDMPLKVLHGILVDPPIGIVGLSNWTLDAAKMNRAICLQRPEPASNDIHLTGEYILGSAGDGMQRLLQQLSVSYHEVYTNQLGRDFVGMRDYYQTVKLLKRDRKLLQARDCVFPRMQFLRNDESDLTYLTITDVNDGQVFTAEKKEPISVYDTTCLINDMKLVPYRILTEEKVNELAEMGPGNQIYPPRDADLINEVQLRREKGGASGPISKHLMAYALMRNFGGSPNVVNNVCKAFGTHCFGSATAFDDCMLSPSRLIAANLNDTEARHLMVLTENGAALPLLFDTGLIDRDNTEVLVGSTFRDDNHELHLIQQVNKVKAAMASGKVVLLHNHDNIYESLYDVLNQRYVIRTVLESGKEKRMLRLAIGSRSQLCPVAAGFRIIVVAEAQHAYDNLDLPLLNRFEKQVLNFHDCLTEEQQQKCDRMKEWVQDLCKETTLEDPSHVFSGFVRSTIPSLVFSYPSDTVDRLQKRLAHLAMPVAVMQSTTLREMYPEYMDDRSGFRALITTTTSEKLLMFVTHSPLEQVRAHMIEGWSSLRLSDIGSEYKLKTFITNYFQDDKQSKLLVQCDPMSTPQNTIDHAKRIVEQCYMSWSKGNAVSKQVVFLIHTPPGAKKCARVFSVDFNKNWGVYFIDDISETDAFTNGLLYNSLSELVESNQLDIAKVVTGKLSTALSLLQEPTTGQGMVFSDRVRFVQQLFQRKEFLDLLLGIIKRILKDRCCIGATGLQHHIELALGELSAGSLKASLSHVVEYLLIQITAHVLRAIHVDFNLFTLTEEAESLWHELARRVLDEDIIVSTAPIDGVPRASEVKNTGTVRVLKAEFPFSYRLIHIHEKAREPIMKQSSINYEGFTAMADQLHGTEVTSKWNAWAKGCHTAYLQDLVCTTACQHQGLEWEQLLALHTAVLKATNPAVLSSPLALHAAMWANEQRLFYLCSLLSVLKPGQQDTVIKQLEAAAHEDQPSLAVRLVLGEMKEYVSSMGRIKKLADWAHRVYSSLMLDCKALGGDVGNWPLVADFIKLVVLQNHSLMPALGYYMPQLFGLERKVAALEDVFARAPVQPDGNVKDAFLVTFIRDYALPAGDKVQEDILRLACGLRPKLYSGNGPAAEPTRRGLFHTLVAHDGLEATIKTAGTLPMGPKYSESLAVLILGYLEDMTVQNGHINERDVAIIGDAKILSYDYLLSVAKARAELRKYAAVLQDVCYEQQTIIVEEGMKRPLPKSSPQLSIENRKLFEIPECGFYILGVLAADGGYNNISEFLQIGRNYNWFIKFDRAFAESCNGNVVLPGLMPLVCSSRDQFTAVKTALKSAVRGGAPAKQRASELFRDKDIALDVKLCALCDAMTEGALRKDFTGQEIIHQWLQDLPDSVFGSFLLRGGWGPTSRFGSTHFQWPAKALPLQLNSLYPLICQVALLIPRVKGSYLELLANSPEALQKTFIPSMPISSEVSTIMQSFNEYVTWYKCPNGHLYSIGECGGPMEIGVCSHPGCRARIGGTDHNVLIGNVRLGGFRDIKKELGAKLKGEPGYIPDSQIEVLRPTSNLARVSACVLRVLMYAALVVAHINGKNLTNLNKALQPRYLHSRLVGSYEALRSACSGLKAGDLMICCNVAIERVGILLQSMNAPFMDIPAMIKFERAVEEVVSTLFQNPKPILESAYRIVGQGNNAELVNKVFSEASVDRIFNSKGLWKVGPAVDVAHFKNYFGSNSTNAEKHPLLAAVVENEERLNIIRYLADILEWHQILFKVLEGDELTRIQAHEIPAEAVLARVNEADRPRARRALEGYCAVFNKAMPLLPNLHECQANPFLDAEGRVNLQGAAKGPRVELTPKAPISFSLPSMVPGEVDAPGLCTIQLGGLLHRAHNQVVEQLKEVLPEQGEVMIPTLSYETPPEVSRRLLISYESARDFTPLLYKYKVEFEGYLGYDLDGIEKELMMTVFSGKMPLQLQVAHFEYYGEVRQRGGLAALANLDQVASLPTAMEEAVIKEMNTQQQLSMLMRLVGDAINFVAAVGSAIRADTQLAAFFKDVMGLAESEIAAKVPPAVIKFGKVSHLKALFLLAEGLMSGGGAFHRVNVKYTAKLDEECEMEIRRSAGHLRHSHLAGALRELIVGPLSGPDVTFPETESLKDYIGYQDMDVGASEWFDKHFPEILQLRHAVATYELITKLALKQ